MTREEHVQWVKDRAKQEYDYYVGREGHDVAVGNATASVLSDMRKHEGTQDGVLAIGALMLGLKATFRTKADVYRFIDGIN